MIKKTNNIYEIGLKERESNIWFRTFKSFKNYLIALTIGFVINVILKGYNTFSLLSYFLVISVFFSYCFIINRKILFKIRHHVELDEIELISIRYNRANVELIAARDAVQILVRQNFSFRYPMWKIFFYHKKKLILSQNELNGWDKEMFLKIEEYFKKPSQ